MSVVILFRKGNNIVYIVYQFILVYQLLFWYTIYVFILLFWFSISLESILTKIWSNEHVRSQMRKSAQPENIDDTSLIINSFNNSAFMLDVNDRYKIDPNFVLPVCIQLSADSIALYPKSKFGQYGLAPCFVKFLQLDPESSNHFW